MSKLSCGACEYSLLLNKSGSTDSDGSDHSSDGIHLGEDHLSGQLCDQVLTQTSSREAEVIDEWELIEEQHDLNSIDNWELFEANELMQSCPKTNIITSPSEIAADDIPLEVSNESEHSIVRTRVNSFERKINVRRMRRALAKNKKVVFYFTSLKCVRSTQEDCQEARRILQEYDVCMDEIDVSTYAKFKEELNELLGMNFRGKLPRVFVGGYYIGGFEEVRKLHLSGKLGYVLKECSKEKPEEKDGNLLCPGCDDQRVLPCLNCCGNSRSGRLSLECTEECENEVYIEWCQECNKNRHVSCPVCR